MATPPGPAYLLVPKEQFAAELATQIAAGDQLGERAVSDRAQLEAARADFSNWSDYNSELLRRRFTTTELADAYRVSASVGVWGGVTSLSDDIESYRSAVRLRLRRLRSIEGRLRLFEEAAASVPRGAITPSHRSSAATASSIFIVHGHDEAAKLAVHGFLRQVTKLDPVILHDKPNAGRTIIEKFEDAGAGSAFAVVILTGDDIGRAANEDHEQPRGRQNVVWEFGYFVGLLGRDRTAVLYEPGVELPSDVHGLLYIPFDGPGGWKLLLARELKAAGIEVDGAALIS